MSSTTTYIVWPTSWQAWYHTRRVLVLQWWMEFWKMSDWAWRCENCFCLIVLIHMFLFFSNLLHVMSIYPNSCVLFCPILKDQSPKVQPAENQHNQVSWRTLQLPHGGIACLRTLYSFISFGVAPDGSPSVLDPPEHLFRIRLACTLLDTCGQYFDRGSSKRKLDCFLVYFQRYVWWKKSQEVWSAPASFPIDVDYLVSDTLEMLRPRMRLCTSLEDASQQVLALQQEYLAKIGLGGSGKAGNLETVAGPEEEDDYEDEEEGETDQSGSDANIHEDEEKTENEEDEDYEDEDVANYQIDSNKETETDDDGGVTLRSGLLKPIA
uniref:MIF4G domain-containing protein n=1 Tax=Eptatretus burgeri TaxID=7764 RepID=A0A8C4QU93_EPTBU